MNNADDFHPDFTQNNCDTVQLSARDRDRPQHAGSDRGELSSAVSTFKAGYFQLAGIR